MQRGQLLSREAGRSVPNPPSAPNKKGALVTQTTVMCCGSATFRPCLCAAAIPPRGLPSAVRDQKIGNVYVFRGEKKMKRNAIAGAVVSALGLLAGSEAHAAAFALYEQGVSGLGNAYAGAAAVAEDATTVWWNPAGMARLGSGKHFAIAGTSISPSTKFSK